MSLKNILIARVRYPKGFDLSYFIILISKNNTECLCSINGLNVFSEFQSVFPETSKEV